MSQSEENRLRFVIERMQREGKSEREIVQAIKKAART
jgi:hypothetical protein